MINNIKYILSVFMILSVALMAIDPETEKIMPFVNDNGKCMACHNTDRMKQKIKKTADACDRFCISCHRKTADKHHNTGMLIRERETLSLPLTGSGRMACITCHDLKIKRYDNTSWKAQSLFDRTFRSKDRYNTYYLTEKNNDGALCQKCH